MVIVKVVLIVVDVVVIIVILVVKSDIGSSNTIGVIVTSNNWSNSITNRSIGVVIRVTVVIVVIMITVAIVKVMYVQE